MSRLLVLAGPNGSGKSSVAGALLRQHGGDYFNPDEVARAIAAGMSPVSLGPRTLRAELAPVVALARLMA